MNKNLTSKVIALCVCLLSLSTTNAQLSSLFSFLGTPTLVSGVANKVNAVYRYTNVALGTDALIKIVSTTGGATIDILDDNSVTKPEAFSPKIKVPGKTTGLVEFKIDFVLVGTSIPRSMDSVFVTALDIDGTDKVKEQDIIDLGGGTASYMAANPEIVLTQSGTSFIGTNVAGIDYDAIDTLARQVMFTVRKKGATSITYFAGAINSGNGPVSRQKSLYFKDFYYPAYSTLPVKYISFDAAVTGENVLLKWITSEEINNSHFEVERSMDMNNFSTIGVVMDGFEVGATKRYQLKDAVENLKGQPVVYYRLKQFDLDGKYTYSNVISVRQKSSNSSAKMTVLPNPFAENLVTNYTASENGTATIQVISASGVPVISKQVNALKGTNNIQLSGLSGLSNGMYIARLVVDGKVIASEKIIKN